MSDDDEEDLMERMAAITDDTDGNTFDRAMAEGDTVEPTETARELIANLKHIRERK